MILEAARNRLQKKFDQLRGSAPVQVEVTAEGIDVVDGETGKTFSFAASADFAELLLELGEIDVNQGGTTRLEEAYEILENFESET